ncbi:MAG: DUF2007 domain-containing protein [Gammaproteobacteria bacterium]|nr:DUF2007 domain-containing protein [Gammaproteobacteria bacterium]MDH5735353.1 DUF2007 domain-containing protein [Gammaproteobacteria bacterium]
MIKIYSAANITEAHILKGLLESNGIEVYVGGHYLQGGIGELPASDFASLHVNNEQMDVAKKIIHQYENNTYNSNNESETSDTNE